VTFIPNKKIVLGLVLIILLFVTQQAPAWAIAPIESSAILSPARINEASQNTVEIVRLRSKVLPGVLIGGHYNGILPRLQDRYTAVGQLDEEVEDAARSLIEDELSSAGLNVMRSPSNVLFADEIPDGLEPGRFLLGGTITQASLKSYSSWWGERTEDERTIQWQVFDREKGRVVYTQTASGKAQVTGVHNLAATYEAIRASVRSLLTEPAFIAALTPSSTSAPLVRVNYQISAIASAAHPLTVEQVVGRSIPSIVQIRTAGGRGTGFLIDSTGLIITNQHVVESALTVKVDLYDGSTHTGRVLKRDRTLDAALVQLAQAEIELPALPMCYTNAVKVGESVVAIGNPMSLSNTATQGIVSGFRNDSFRNLIQTDAAINPGNSGGPLLNRRGAVVGIVTEKMVSRGVEGLGFALPIGEALHRLNVQISTPLQGMMDACGTPVTTLAGTKISN